MRGVAVTGIGLVSALGRGADEHLAALKQGKSGMAGLTLFTADGVPPSPVGEVAERHLAPEHWAGRSERLALTAARDALGSFCPEGAGALLVGTTTGGIYESEQHYLKHRGADGEQDKSLLRHHAAGAIADRLAHRLSVERPPLSGERHTFSTACSSSANAIGYGAALVQAGLPWALAGGVDSLCRLTYSGFYSLKLLASQQCRPFDRRRVGLNLGEAAAFLLLEPLEAARRRGVPVLGLVAGWGCAADAHHMTAPHPEGKGAAAAIEAALADAGLSPEEVGYVNAHGTATPANDKAEALALKAVFGDRIPPVSSTKGATGHTLGAAGALEAAFCLLALRTGYLPPTVGLEEPEAEPALPHVPQGGLRQGAFAALSNSFGFGGNNAALVLTRGER